ncbi:hypothetical protein N431DRAFT_523215 [Stipitochalara longipes BDJ]|nr:hypothetical protein N431DRAFT_523215 [Stipitochalara longipes BDJ]
MESFRRLYELEAQNEELPISRRRAAQLRPAPISNTGRDTTPNLLKIESQLDTTMSTISWNGNDSEKNNNAQLAVRTKSLNDTTKQMGIEPLNTFTCFPKLAPELQNLVWAWAAVLIPESSPRVFWVSSDLDDPEEAFSEQLRIFPAKGLSIPSLLTVCREARRAALPEYTVWQLAEVESVHHNIPAVAFINKSYDTVYFRGMSDFYFFDLLSVEEWTPNPGSDPVVQACFTSAALAWKQLSAQFACIENMAMSWEQWHLLCNDGLDIKWLRNLPHLKTLTIVYCLIDEDPKDRDFVTFTPRLVDLRRGTGRFTSGKKILWWVQKCLERFSARFPECPIPGIRIKQFRPRKRNDKIVADDLNFALALDKNYELEGKRHFGKMPEV